MESGELSYEIQDPVTQADGFAEIIVGSKQEVAEQVFGELLTHFKDNQPGSLGAEREAEYRMGVTAADLECVDCDLVDDRIDSPVATEQLSTWLVHPNYPTPERPYGYALATLSTTKASHASLFRVDISGNVEDGSSVTTRFDVELGDLRDTNNETYAAKMADCLKQEELEIFSALIDKSSKASFSGQSPNNDQRILFELTAANIDELEKNPIVVRSVEKNKTPLDTVFDKDLARDARRVLREHKDGSTGELRVTLHYIKGEVDYFVDIQGTRKDRRDHIITGIRLLAQNERDYDQVDYMNPEEFELKWLAHDLQSVEELFEKGDQIHDAVFDQLWQNPGEYDFTKRTDV